MREYIISCESISESLKKKILNDNEDSQTILVVKNSKQNEDIRSYLTQPLSTRLLDSVCNEISEKILEFIKNSTWITISTDGSSRSSC